MSFTDAAKVRKGKCRGCGTGAVHGEKQPGSRLKGRRVFAAEERAAVAEAVCSAGGSVQELLRCVRAPPLSSAERDSGNSGASAFCPFFYYVFLICHQLFVREGLVALCSQSSRDNPAFIRERQQLFSREFVVTLSSPKASVATAFFHVGVVPLCRAVHSTRLFPSFQPSRISPTLSLSSSPRIFHEQPLLVSPHLGF